MRTLLPSLLLTIGVSSGVQASDSPSTTGGIINPANQTHVVCRKEMVTGSRIPKRVCRTKRGMAEDRHAGRQAVQEAIRVNGSLSPAGGMRSPGRRGG